MNYPSGPVMVWELAGRPRRESLRSEQVPAVCAMCGQYADETVHTRHTIGGKSFTDQYLLARPDSDRTCYGCAWCCTGKGMDQIRMWTIVARTDRVLPPSNPKAIFASPHVHFTSRADMRMVVETLADPPDGPWLVAVAESGQKHTVPYARVNHGAGRWTVRMDAADITATPAQFRCVFGHAVRLRAAGFTAAEIEELAPSVHRLTPEVLPVWRHHAAELEPYRGSGLLHLAVFMINKEHLDEYVTRYGAPTPGPGDADRMGEPVHQCPAGHPRGGAGSGPGCVDPSPHRAGDGDLDGVLF